MTIITGYILHYMLIVLNGLKPSLVRPSLTLRESKENLELKLSNPSKLHHPWDVSSFHHSIILLHATLLTQQFLNTYIAFEV